MLRLEKGIDYDAPDGELVDLVFGLVVPEESTDEHLQVLSRLAETFSDDEVRSSVRSASGADELCGLITGNSDES